MVSCKRGDGMEDFTKKVFQKIKDMESCKKVFPGRWFRIKERLADMKDEEGQPCNYIREEQYRNECKNEGIVDRQPQDTLLSWMNDLGVCFSYNSRTFSGSVNEIKVLRPEWITNGVYKIITSKEANDANGFISHEEIQNILIREDDVNALYRNTEKDFILGMMRDFKLSYQVEQFEFIPMLTKDSEPDIEAFIDEAHLQIRYNVPIPTFVLYTFIVQMKSDVVREKTWKKGAFFEGSYGDCRAVVRFGKDRKTIDILTTGGNKVEYLRFLRRNLEYAQQNMESDFEEFVEYKVDGKSAYLKLERLLKMLRKGMAKDYADDIDQDVDVIKVLSTIAPDAVIKELLSNLSKSETENRQLKERKENIEEMRNTLLGISEDTKKMAQVLDSLDWLKQRVEHMETYTESQLDDIKSVFSEMEKLRLEPKILNIVVEVLKEVKKTNYKTLKEHIVEFIGIAGSFASLAPYLAPYIEKLIAIFV
jgi:hypothetical protein